ncbi:MAG TPA: YraN family protein [Patescibacteria group bacterium]|nr:YraN family protein [Patescibacteria group bacterium]
MNRKALGNSGEDAAEHYLRERGYEILNRNYRTRLGEIDIIAREGRGGKTSADASLVFVEVKTRRSLCCGSPGEAVNYFKQQKIIATAQCYLNMVKQPEAICRFDVLEIYMPVPGEIRYNHIKNAFGR